MHAMLYDVDWGDVLQTGGAFIGGGLGGAFVKAWWDNHLASQRQRDTEQRSRDQDRIRLIREHALELHDRAIDWAVRIWSEGGEHELLDTLDYPGATHPASRAVAELNNQDVSDAWQRYTTNIHALASRLTKVGDVDSMLALNGVITECWKAFSRVLAAAERQL
jgi:hypothetical protein